MKIHAAWCYVCTFADTDDIATSYKIAFNNCSNDYSYGIDTNEATDTGLDDAYKVQETKANEDKNDNKDKDKDKDKDDENEEEILLTHLWA